MTWREVKDAEGRTYYFDDKTQQSTWEKPDELLTSLERALKKTEWKQFTADGGKIYYHSSKTQESLWEIPEEVQKLIEEEKTQATANESNATASSSSTGANSVPIKQQPIVPNVPNTHGLQSISDPKEKYHNESVLLNNQLSVRHKEEAEAIFTEMLRENHVDATWAFSTIVDTFIKDPRYWAIADALEKKQVFENYLNNRTKEELLKENNSIEKFKEAFLKLLQSSKQVHYYTRWKTARSLIQNEPIYAHSVISEKVKRQTFQEYADSLRKIHDDQESKLRDQALEELREYFKTLNLNLSSTWESTLSLIKSDIRFEQNKHFQILNQLDLLDVFQSNIRNLQKDYESRIFKIEKQNYRNNRKARDGFNSLLVELKESGLLRADTKWSEIFPLIKEDDRFLQLLGRQGSTPVELFWDVIDEEELIIRAKKDIVTQLLLHNNFTVQDIGIDLEEQKLSIRKILSKDEKTKDYDDDSIDLIYAKLLNQVKEDREKDKFAQERKLRRSQEDFKAYLRRLDTPRITPESTWEEIKPHVENSAEYKALPSDESRIIAFEKFVKRLKEKKIEMEANKEREIRNIIASVSSSRQEIAKKRAYSPPREPVMELDY